MKVKSTLYLLFICTTLIGQNIAPELVQSSFPENNITPFPDSEGFELESEVTFDPAIWHPMWDEENVFKAQLSTSDYQLRIGQGGQLYSINSEIGELCPPQWLEHAWVDDMWLLTTYQYDLGGLGGGSYTPFIHQCGVYPHTDPGEVSEDFWAPVVAEYYDSIDHSFSTISLGLISTGPSYNRADMLMYHKTRELGDGVFEVVYMAYNYNSSYTDDEAIENYTTDYSPWGGVRETQLPDHIISNPDGSSETHDTDGLHWHDAISTGGWAISAQDAENPDGYAMGLVFGKDKPTGTASKTYSHGFAGAARDFSVQAITFRQQFKPGRLFFSRQFFVLGDLDHVKEKSQELEAYADGGFIDYIQAESTLKPLYLEESEGQTVIVEDGEIPAFYVYTEPVRDSKPLYLIKNNLTGEFHATCDPFMSMTRYPITHPSGETYEGYRPYDGSVSIIKIFGYVIPEDFADATLSYVRLDEQLLDLSYYPQEGIYDTDIMVIKGETANSPELNSFDFNIYPNPANDWIVIRLNCQTDPANVSLQLSDNAGKVVLNQDFSAKNIISIDISNFEKGHYIITISREDHIVNKQLIIQ